MCVCARACMRACTCMRECVHVCLSSLVYVVGIIYVYVDTVFGIYGYFFFFFFNCLVGCLSMIVWTPAVLGVFYACVLYFCNRTCSSQLSMFTWKGALEIRSLLLLLLSLSLLSIR